MTLTLDIHKGSCTNLVDCIYQLCYHRLKQCLKYPLFYRFPIQKHKGPNLTIPSNRSRSTQGHCLNKLGMLEYSMRHANVLGQSSFGSREEDF